jgi:RNA polymerase sigma factor (sigma-70 family)
MTATATVPRVGDFEVTHWPELVSRYGGLLRAIAGSFRLTRAEAEDAAQTTWLRLVQHADSLRDPDRVGGWLRTTMRHTCLEIVRQRQRERLTGGSSDWPMVDVGPNLDSDLMRTERNATLWKAVDDLPRQQRELLRALFATIEQSYEEVSIRLSIPVGGIGPTRNRALSRLRRVLHQAGVDLDDLR